MNDDDDVIASQVIDYFEIGKDDTRVASITYGSTATLDFDFDYSFAAATVKTKLQAIGYRGGGTYTYLALQQAHTIYKTTNHGARPTNKGVPRVIVLLTDGQSYQHNIGVQYANALKQDNVAIFAIGLGGNGYGGISVRAPLPPSRQPPAPLPSPPCCPLPMCLH